jgi:hypothetical protein
MRKESGERARRLRTPRFVLQVVKDEAVGGEGGYAARLALGDGAHLVGVLAPLRRREAVEAQAVAAPEDVVSKLGSLVEPLRDRSRTQADKLGMAVQRGDRVRDPLRDRAVDLAQ